MMDSSTRDHRAWHLARTAITTLDPAELQRIAAEIGEQILALAGRKTLTCPICEASAGACSVPAAPVAPVVGAELAALIDHTVLKPDAVRADIEKLCAEARQYGFASVCVNACWASLAAQLLEGSSVKVCTVVGFPLGATSTAAKACEAETAIRVGAREIDMVVNVGALKGGDYLAVKLDIEAVAEVCQRGGALLKVILETALLSDEEKVAGALITKLAGADFVKTSTGFAKQGATVHDVALLRQVVGPEMGVKAAGGIRTLEDLRAMVAAGATRIGASAGVKIIEAAAR
jgi:deoxyribose-phosphate aldolase